MNLLIHLFIFLGTIHFAIFLIASTLLFVAAGTFLEAWSQSHLFASRWTYHNPLFSALLWGYLINISFSAIRRYPFKKKQLPFLTTHFGLIMILGGVLIKNQFGMQGVLSVTEGETRDSLLLPHTYALLVQNREETSCFPLNHLPPAFKIVEWIPHSEERLEGWIKGEWGMVIGLPPLPVHAYQDPLPLSLRTEEYDIIALKTDRIEEAKQKAYRGRPLLLILQETNGHEHLIAFDKEKKTLPESLYAVDQGFGGYLLKAHFADQELLTPLTFFSYPLPPHAKQEELKPRIKLLIHEKEEIALTYHPRGEGLKWPMLEGHTLVRFQPMEKKIPFKISYPHSEQEGDLLIDGQPISLRVNHVYEKNRYQFSLSHFSVQEGIKRVDLIVNYDPAKYLLTYPGICLLIIGILSFLIRRRYAP